MLILIVVQLLACVHCTHSSNRDLGPRTLYYPKGICKQIKLINRESWLYFKIRCNYNKKRTKANAISQRNFIFVCIHVVVALCRSSNAAIIILKLQTANMKVIIIKVLFIQLINEKSERRERGIIYLNIL